MTTLHKRAGNAPTERENVTDVIDSLRSLIQALRASGREVEQKVGISSAQLYILQELQARPGQSINELARSTYTHQSSVSNVVGRLFDSRLVTRTQSKEDARRVNISISASGRSLLKKAPRTEQERLLAALKRLSTSELADLARTLSLLSELLADSRPAATGSKARRMSLEA